MGSIRYRPRKISGQVADSTATWTYAELVLRAHRLRGRAALFEISAMAEAANTLEQAATRASMSPTSRNDVPVKVALAKLVRLVATMAATGPDDSDVGAG